MPVAELGQPGGVLEGRLRVVHRARAGDHQQPVVGTVKHRADLGPGGLDGLRLGVAERLFKEKRGRGKQRLVADDPGIRDA